MLEVVPRRCSLKKLILKFTQNLRENTCATVSFSIKLQISAGNFIKKETLTRVFSCEFCEFFKNTVFRRTTTVAASEMRIRKILSNTWDFVFFQNMKAANYFCKKLHLRCLTEFGYASEMMFIWRLLRNSFLHCSQKDTNDELQFSVQLNLQKDFIVYILSGILSIFRTDIF